LPDVYQSAFDAQVRKSLTEVIGIMEWGALSPSEKREQRYKRWLSPDIKFGSRQAEEAYKTRVTRFIKAINLEQPDRVPVMLPSGYFPAYYNGKNLRQVMYDYQEMRRAWLRYLAEFDMDAFGGPGLVLPGKALDIIDFKLHKWPGHGLSPDASSSQFVEGEYMTVDDYDALIKDPSDFWFRTFLPRAAGAFEPFRKIAPLTPMVSLPIFYLTSIGKPDVQAAFQKFLKAGRECARWSKIVGACNRKALKAGFPTVTGGMTGAPFDILSDSLRGTKGIFLDMFQRPKILFEAMERVTSTAIEEAVVTSNASGCPVIFIALHKGADSFMSVKQYETFYWPSMKKLIKGLVDEGLVPMIFAEGSYNQRLEIIKDVPPRSVIWYFERVDMAKAKQILGNISCIAGNVPTSLLCTGSPREVKQHCRNLIEIAGKGGGYILAGAASINQGDPENLRAMMAAVKEYGRY
jgi:uroporphyrinogen-III decarboxylase